MKLLQEKLAKYDAPQRAMAMGNLSLLQGNPERSGHGSSNQREESLDVWF